MLLRNKSLWISIMGFVLLGAFISVLSNHYHNEAKNAKYMTMQDSEESSEAFFLRIRKEQILENSYETSIDLGKEYLQKNLFDVASTKYFDAKSIYPSAIEPRMSLSKIYYKWAFENPAYCWQAQKEVLFALQYVKLSQYPEDFRSLKMMEANLNKLCGEGGNFAFLERLDEENNPAED